MKEGKEGGKVAGEEGKEEGNRIESWVSREEKDKK